MFPQYRYWAGDRMVFSKNKSELFLDCFNNGICKIMFSTGEKDIKGKTIYEGDIVKTLTSYGVIKFGVFIEELSSVKGWFVSEVNHWNDDWPYREYSIMGYEFEVIGNIYENPDLKLKYDKRREL